MVLLRYWHDPPEKSHMFFCNVANFAISPKIWRLLRISLRDRGSWWISWKAIVHIAGTPAPPVVLRRVFGGCPWYSKPNPGETTEVIKCSQQPSKKSSSPHLGKGRMDAAKFIWSRSYHTQGSRPMEDRHHTVVQNAAHSTNFHFLSFMSFGKNGKKNYPHVVGSYFIILRSLEFSSTNTTKTH